MTVTYYPHIATVKKGVLFRLLLRWKGSLYKLVLPEILAFLILYSTLSLIYRYGLTQDQKCAFEGVCIYLHAYMNSTSITFSLGFFVSYVMNRWWETFKTMPWLYTPAYVIRQIIIPPRTQSRPHENQAQANTAIPAQVLVNPQPLPQMNNLDKDNVALNSHPNDASNPNQHQHQHQHQHNVVQKNTQPTAAPNGTVQHAKPTAPTTCDSDKAPESADSKYKSGEHVVATNAQSASHPAEERRITFEDALSVRLALMRYLLLAWIFAIRRISAPVMIRFKPTEKLSDAKLREKLAVLNTDPYIQRYVDPLITEQEQDAVVAYARLLQGDQADTYEPDHYVPLSWATDLIHEAHARGFIASHHLVRELLSCFKEFRGGLGMLRFMDQFNIPLVYTQVVALSMYIYFVIVCFSQQFLEHSRTAGPSITTSNASLGNDSTLTVSVSVTGGGGGGGRRSLHELDLFLPLPSILYLMFLLGWLRVAEVCLNPFGEDDDDFPTWQILNMNVETAFKIINVFELDRVYDGSLHSADHREQHPRRISNAFIAATGCQAQVQAMRARALSRRSSIADGHRRDRGRESISIAPIKGRVDLPVNDVGQDLNETSLHDLLQDRCDDRDDHGDHAEYSESDAFSCYLDEPLESVRRGNYEQLRKKYERPLYLGGALETEMLQNPASIQPSDVSVHHSEFPPSHTSRVTAFARQISSALHLPGLQHHASRTTMTNAPDDSASRIVHAPLLPYQSSSIAGSGSHSRRQSVSSASQANPAWRADQSTNRRVHKLSAPTHRLSDTPAREMTTIPASPCRSPQHDHVADAESGSLSNRSVSHIEMHQVCLDRSDDGSSSPLRIPRASSSSSFASGTDSGVPRSLAASAAVATSSSEAPGTDSVPAHTVVGSRHNLNRIVEAIEIDCDAPSTPTSGAKHAGN